MTRELDRDDLALTCTVSWTLAEWDNGDQDPQGTVGSYDMPEGMRGAIQDWLETNEGMDWILTRPRNPKRAAECVGEPSARRAQGASQPPAAFDNRTEN